jgi:tetratricopeptide (TPR) repeat protein
MNKIVQFISNHTLAIILLFGFIIHLPYLQAGFVWVDHHDIVEKNALITSINQIPEVFSMPFGTTSFYRPAVVLTNSIDYAYHGNFAFGFHLTNLVLHLLVVYFLGIFLESFVPITRKVIYVAQFIFAVHPMSILIVGAVTRRQETMLALFYFLTIIYYAKARLGKRLIDILFSSFFFLLALFTKETSIGLIPLTLIIWESVQANFSKKRISLQYLSTELKTNVGLILTFLGVLFMYMYMRFHILGFEWNTKAPDLTLSEHIALKIELFWKWIVYSISPFPPQLSDSMPIHSFFEPKVIVIALSLSIAIMIIFRKKASSIPLSVWALYLISILPGLNFIPVPRVGTPNYGYLPAAIASCMLALLLNTLPRKFSKAGFMLLALWSVIAASSVYTSGSHFENDLTLFTPEVQKDPSFIEGYYFLGNYYLQRNDLENAGTFFQKASDPHERVLSFGNTSAYTIYLAGIRLEQERWDEADELYDKAKEGADETLFPVILFNKALIADERGDYGNVIKLLTQYTQWNRAEPFYLLAKAYSSLGEEKQSREMAEKAERLEKSSDPSSDNYPDIFKSNE